MNDGSFQLRIEDIIRAILKQKTLIILMTLVGLVAGAALTFVAYMQGEMSRHYRIKASIVVVMQTDSGNYSSSGKTSPQLSDVQMANQIMESAIYVLDSELLVERAMSRMPLDPDAYTASDIASALSVKRYDETLVAELSLTWDSAEEGIAVMNALLEAAPEVLQETFQVGSVSVVTQPYVSGTYGGTINKMLFILVAALGMFGGVGIAVLQLFVMPTLMDLRDVENKFGLDVLGEIPIDPSHFSQKRDLIRDAEEPDSDIAECFSSCAHILKNQLGTGKNICIYVTSSIHDEGKSVTAANLAACLAAMENKVLLIDFDTKKPSIGTMFLPEIEYERSLNAVYRGEIEVQDAILPITGYLDILPAVLERNSIPLDNAIFEMVRKLKQKYDYVIIDTAPVGLSSNTMNLNQVADTSLFVLRYDFASISEIRNALGRLDKSGIQVAGCVVNAIQSLDYLLGKGNKPSESSGKQKHDKGEPKAKAPRKSRKAGRNSPEPVNTAPEPAPQPESRQDPEPENPEEPVPKAVNAQIPDTLSEFDLLDHYFGPSGGSRGASREPIDIESFSDGRTL